MNEQRRRAIKELLRVHMVGVLATVAEDGSAEAATIEFGHTDDLEIIFDTSTTFRKFRNLRERPRVAFVVGGNEGENVAIQIEGIARQVIGEEREKYAKIYFSKVANAAKWALRSDTAYFVIDPKWIRYRDYNQKPNEMFEVTF